MHIGRQLHTCFFLFFRFPDNFLLKKTIASPEGQANFGASQRKKSTPTSLVISRKVQSRLIAALYRRAPSIWKIIFSLRTSPILDVSFHCKLYRIPLIGYKKDIYLRMVLIAAPGLSFSYGSGSILPSSIGF